MPAIVALVLSGILWVFIGYYMKTDPHWVPILDNTNLVIHEAGHPLVGILSSNLAVYGGTWFQLLFPMVVWWKCHKRYPAVAFQDPSWGMYWLAKSFSTGWLLTSLQNMARYLADARAQQLPLIGGLPPETSHDWFLILGRWDLLKWDTTFANIWFMVVTMWWLWLAVRHMGWAWTWWRGKKRLQLEVAP